MSIYQKLTYLTLLSLIDLFLRIDFVQIMVARAKAAIEVSKDLLKPIGMLYPKVICTI